MSRGLWKKLAASLMCITALIIMLLLMIWTLHSCLTHSQFAVTTPLIVRRASGNGLRPSTRPIILIYQHHDSGTFFRELPSHTDGIDWSVDNDMSPITEMSRAWSHQNNHYRHQTHQRPPGHWKMFTNKTSITHCTHTGVRAGADDSGHQMNVWTLLIYCSIRSQYTGVARSYAGISVL